MGIEGAVTVYQLSIYRWRVRPVELVTRLFQKVCSALSSSAMMES